MQLPRLPDPGRYSGLYAFDFGDHVSVGYTAEEIEVLLRAPAYAAGRAYKIRRIQPDGSIELIGVSRIRTRDTEGLVFRRTNLDDARQDFEELRRVAAAWPPPSAIRMELAHLRGGRGGYAIALSYAAEYADEVARWLARTGYGGGDDVDGGPAALEVYRAAGPQIMDQASFDAPADRRPRAAAEVLARVNWPLQR